MRTTFFTTQLQATSGHVQVFSTHQTAGIVQSQESVDSIQSRIETLHAHLTNEPPHTPPTAKHILETYAIGIDVALLVHKENALVLATHGSGIIYLKRNGKIAEVVGDGLIAQGPLISGDEFILTTNEFLDLIGGVEGLEYYFLRYTSAEVVEMMKTYEDQSVASGFVSVSFGSFQSNATKKKNLQPDVAPIQPVYENQHSIEATSSDTEDAEVEEVQDVYEENVDIEDNIVVQGAKSSRGHPSLNILKSHFTRIFQPLINLARKRPKVVIVSAIFLIGAILLIRFILSGPTARPVKTQSIETIQSDIKSILDEVSTATVVNIAGVEPLILDARAKLEKVSFSDKRRYATELQELADSITQVEKKSLSIVDGKVVEHFVLSLDSGDASAVDADFDGKNFYLLDNVNGVIYKVSSEKRAYEQFKSDKLKGAIAVAASEKDIYVLTASEGIYHIAQDRSTQVIKNNKEWGTITDMRWYAGNLYIIDATRQNIYKYQGVDEKTFGDAISYLVEEAQGNLMSNKRITIDGSVYAAGTTSIVKFVTGRKADFELVLPYATYSLAALYTSPDIENMYVFDTEHDAFLELNKEGLFGKQWIIPNISPLFVGVTKDEKMFLVTNTSILRIE